MVARQTPETPRNPGWAGPSSWAEWIGHFLPMDGMREAGAPQQTAITRRTGKIPISPTSSHIPMPEPSTL